MTFDLVLASALWCITRRLRVRAPSGRTGPVALGAPQASLLAAGASRAAGGGGSACEFYHFCQVPLSASTLCCLMRRLQVKRALGGLLAPGEALAAPLPALRPASRGRLPGGWAEREGRLVPPLRCPYTTRTRSSDLLPGCAWPVTALAGITGPCPWQQCVVSFYPSAQAAPTAPHA